MQESHAAPPGRFYNLSAWLRDHIIVASLIIFFCAAAPRLYLTWLADTKDLITPDSWTYFAPARSMVELESFLDRDKKPEVTRTPGYPVFLAAIMSVVGQDLGKVKLAQAFVLSFAVLFLYWLARRILPPIIAFAGSLLAAGSPWSAVQAGMFMTEGLYLLILALIFLAIHLVECTTKRASAVLGAALVGLLTSAAVLVRPLWPLVLLVALSFFFRFGPSRKGVWVVLTIMLVFAVTPLYMWKTRNLHEAQFNGLSDISGKTALLYLASRVKAQVDGVDRGVIYRAALLDENKWGLSIQEADNERWRRVRAVFREHPFVTVYCFTLSAVEHIIHPDPFLLKPAKLNFSADYWLLGLAWVGLLVLAFLGSCCTPSNRWDDGAIDRGWLFMLLAVCFLLSLASGLSYYAGSRLRIPLELIVPLLAAVGGVRTIRAFHRNPVDVAQEEPLSQISNDKSPVLAVIIPVYNEVQTVERLIKSVLASPVNMKLRLFVVNDASNDGSDKVLERLAAGEPRITVLHHESNLGKGMAIRTAIAAADGDFAIIQDADFEYNPEEYEQIVAPLLRGDAEAVFGSRYLNKGERQVFPFWHSLGNWILTTSFNVAHNVHLTDMETCYKAMPLKLLKILRLTSNRFGIEPELAARLVAVRVRIIEVPISYKARSYQEGKKIGWRDGMQAFWLILKFKFLDTIPCIDVGMVRHLAMADAPRYQQAIIHEIKPFLGERVLEVGAGIGNLARYLTDTKALFLAESVPEYRRQLAASMQYYNRVTIVSQDPFSRNGLVWAKSRQLDTVVCINQLEFIKEDKLALSHLAESIEMGGRVIIRVACHEILYGSLDHALGRLRRYNGQRLTDLLAEVGLQIEYQRWQGKLLLLGWFIQGKILQRQFFSSKPFVLVNIFSPIMTVLDNWLPWKGLSLLVVVRKLHR